MDVEVAAQRLVGELGTQLARRTANLSVRLLLSEILIQFSCLPLVAIDSEPPNMLVNALVFSFRLVVEVLTEIL